jgi:hypothetical protein
MAQQNAKQLETQTESEGSDSCQPAHGYTDPW